MIRARTKAPESTGRQWPNARLVQECLKGNDTGWHLLVDKYKNLIYSIPLKYGLSQEDAADIFQAVCLELLSELPRLREPEALPAWLLRVTYHKCYHWKRDQMRYVSQEPSVAGEEAAEGQGEAPQEILSQVEREQALRDALTELTPRCRQLVQMLFFEVPALPYREVAGRLGIRTGSVGFIRGRCLGRLRKRLEKAGFV
ncbi:MAG: sigma-70 family RNA polymerase sigma factor [Acidobacteria bacterium]|nr:MAG: sigma-70 family RNA polymerase sigma factor [Acidobacteriota bacterium]